MSVPIQQQQQPLRWEYLSTYLRDIWEKSQIWDIWDLRISERCQNSHYRSGRREMAWLAEQLPPVLRHIHNAMRWGGSNWQRCWVRSRLTSQMHIHSYFWDSRLVWAIMTCLFVCFWHNPYDDERFKCLRWCIVGGLVTRAFGWHLQGDDK